MIDRGHYQMHRGWQDHPVFGKKPYDERGAWEWLIAYAAHGATTVAVNGEPVELQRGQLCYSVRFLAERWRWSKSRVHRFLQKFAKWDMIQICAKTGTESGTGVTLITVCNYNDYQTPRKKAGQQEGQERDSSGTNKKNEKKTTYLSLESDVPEQEGLDLGSADAPGGEGETEKPKKRKRHQYTPEFEEAWDIYPQREHDSKHDAFKAWSARIREGCTVPEMIAGTERYHRFVRAKRMEPQYIKRAATFYGPALHFQEAWEYALKAA